MRRERIPAAFVEFMQQVVETLESDDEDERSLAEIDDGLLCEDGYGGRDGTGFRFVFYPEGRSERWTVSLTEAEVRKIASAAVPTFDVESAPWKAPKRSAAAALPKAEAQVAAGRRMLDALVAAGLVTLERGARAADLPALVERIVFDAFDAPLADEARATMIVEALTDAAGIEDVFGDEAEFVRVLRPLSEG